jgi:hypothetical protein
VQVSAQGVQSAAKGSYSATVSVTLSPFCRWSRNGHLNQNVCRLTIAHVFWVHVSENFIVPTLPTHSHNKTFNIQMGA